jgi:hypothetical protein
MYLVGRKEGTKEMDAVQGSCSTEKTKGLTHELLKDLKIIMVNIPAENE